MSTFNALVRDNVREHHDRRSLSGDHARCSTRSARTRRRSSPSSTTARSASPEKCPEPLDADPPRHALRPLREDRRESIKDVCTDTKDQLQREDGHHGRLHRLPLLAERSRGARPRTAGGARPHLDTAKQRLGRGSGGGRQVYRRRRRARDRAWNWPATKPATPSSRKTAPINCSKTSPRTSRSATTSAKR